MTIDIDDYLAHHGVLGMHWGKHLPGRTEPSHNSKRIVSHPDHIQKQELKANPTHTLSTQELKKLNDRIQTEKKYKELNPGTITIGKKTILGVVAAGGTALTVYNMINSPGGKAAIKAGQKWLDKLGLKAAHIIMQTI